MRVLTARNDRRRALLRALFVGFSTMIALACSTDPRMTTSDAPSAVTTATVPPLAPIETDDGADRRAPVDPDADPDPDPDLDPVPDLDPDPDAVVDVADGGTPVDRRLLGTNVPAWLGPDRLASDWFRDAMLEAGVELVRMPGGSWSNGYGWSDCELQQDGCIWDEAARPTDFAALLADSGVAGLWTVSINESAQSAAALVAYFNAELEDATVIGVDRDGIDWGTAGDWAAIRAFNGQRDPVRIELWEIGNEVFAGSPETAGDDCVEFGWEAVWTCDGTEYVEGDDEHDGFLDIRAAMLEIDPGITVGAVGVADPSAWGSWGEEVVAAAGDDLDFYALHAYGFDGPPDLDEAGDRAPALWPAYVDTARRSLSADTPIAVTEYNLVAVETADEDRLMTTVVNGLFLADSIGQLALAGVAVANHWNFANGTAPNGTDYGMVHADTGERFPQFDGFAAWARAGDRLLPLVEGAGDEVRVYPTIHDDGSITVIAVRASSGDETLTIEFDGVESVGRATVTSRWAAEPDSPEFETEGPTEVSAVGTQVTVSLPSWSITEIRIEGDDVR